MSESAPILIIEDDPKTSELLSLFLRQARYQVMTALTGREALELAARTEPLLMIVDMMLPDLDGHEVCQRLREMTSSPILVLSARGEARDKIAALTWGADDYVVKPCSFGELVARVKAILRRSGLRRAEGLLVRGALTLDPARRRLMCNGHEVGLTRSEYRLLQMLMSEPGRVYTRQELLGGLYPGGGQVVARVVDVHIANLRQKIESDPSQPRYIVTVRGAGYRFSEIVDSAGES